MALESIDALDALLRSPKAPDDFHRAITESALLNNAVVLYARATKTTSEERAGYDLRHRFTEDEKIAHQELVDLRDSAIAHFGSGKSYAGLWQVDLVLLHVKPEAAKPAVATRRQTIDLKLAARARKQIEATLEMLRTESLNKLAELSAEIEKVASADDEFPNDLAKHPLNLPVFLSSDEAAAHALSGFDDQIYVKGIVSHK